MNLTPTIITYSAEEAFFTSVLLNVSPGLPYYRTTALERNSVTGVTYFSGMANGYVAINMSKEIAALITHDILLGEDLKITEEIIEDTICELTNILAGRVKSYIDPPGSSLHLSLPDICRSSDCLPAVQSDAKQITIPFCLEGGKFWVEVQMTQ